MAASTAVGTKEEWPTDVEAASVVGGIIVVAAVVVTEASLWVG